MSPHKLCPSSGLQPRFADPSVLANGWKNNSFEIQFLHSKSTEFTTKTAVFHPAKRNTGIHPAKRNTACLL